MADTIQRIFPITGKIFSSPYDWGGNKLIPQTLGFEPEPGVPYAEYWLGDHTKAPSFVTQPDGSTITLDQLIKYDPNLVLGENTAGRFGNLPFLFKLLDAGEMLSIQVHPNKQQAEEGFTKEEEAGIALTDPKRTYKDSNHKPEFAVALDDFWLLHGFKQPGELQRSLNEVPELRALIANFVGEDYRRLYTHIMVEMPDDEANTMLDALAKRILPEYKAGNLQKSSPDYWAAKAINYMNMSSGSYDRGLFSIYILNLVNLKAGQAIFQDAGVLHSYLEGQIIEVMTTSDNVARGGITPKHIDVEELLKLIKFEGITPRIVEARHENIEEYFDAPIDEFLVSRIIPTTEHFYKNTSYSAEILMGIQGDATITSGETTLPLSKGKSVFVIAGTQYEIKGNAEVFKVGIPNK